MFFNVFELIININLQYEQGAQIPERAKVAHFRVGY